MGHTAETTQPATTDAPATTASKLPKIAYVMSRFPKLTETFILYEMLAVEQARVPVEVYPLLRARNKRIHQEGASVVRKIAELILPAKDSVFMHPEAARFVERAHYQPFLSWPILKSQFRALFRRPKAYLGALWVIVRANWGSPNFLIGSLAVFPKVVHWAHQMKAGDITHIHAHFANHPAAAAFVMHRLTGIPFSFVAHGADLQVDQHMLREKVAEATFVITDSNYNQRLILDKCGAAYADKVHVLRCGVDSGFFAPAAGNGHRAGGCLEILCIGTFYEVKGQQYLIQACRLLMERGVRFRCRFVGEGADLEALVALVHAGGLDAHIQFLGARRRQEVADLLREADVLVAPSVPTREGRREGIPVVLMEAMASGLPVVSSRISGIPELVEHEKSGLLVEPRDVDALAESLERLAGDPALRRQLGEAGRAKIESEYDLYKNAAQLLNLITRHTGKP